MSDPRGYLLHGLAGVLDGINKMLGSENDPKKDKPEPVETVTLTEDDLMQLRWMSPSQLRAIFGNGARRKAKLAGSEHIYRSLKWFSPNQLEAIFGEEGKSNG